jgi:hypothetical protein
VVAEEPTLVDVRGEVAPWRTEGGEQRRDERGEPKGEERLRRELPLPRGEAGCAAADRCGCRERFDVGGRAVGQGRSYPASADATPLVDTPAFLDSRLVRPAADPLR